MPLTAFAGLCLGWALWAGGSSADPPNLENVENASKSVYRWAGNRHSIRWAIEPDFCDALQPLLWENYTGIPLQDQPLRQRHRLGKKIMSAWALLQVGTYLKQYKDVQKSLHVKHS